MNILNLCLTLPEFQNYVHDFNFGPKLPDKLVIHHTWRPTKVQWQGKRTMLGLKRFYEGKGWKAGPHLFVAEDGLWLFSPMNHDGVHAGKLNRLSIGIEVVGDYDRELWSGNTKNLALGGIKCLMSRLAIGGPNLFFHRDVSPKTCPGKAITKEWLFGELKKYRLRPRIQKPNH